jgi:hypothetical protein
MHGPAATCMLQAKYTHSAATCCPILGACTQVLNNTKARLISLGARGTALRAALATKNAALTGSAGELERTAGQNEAAAVGYRQLRAQLSGECVCGGAAGVGDADAARGGMGVGV